jgi:hypothetical protein
LAPQTIIGYRSDFAQFVESLRDHGRFGLARQDALATFSVEAVRATSTTWWRGAGAGRRAAGASSS